MLTAEDAYDRTARRNLSPGQPILARDLKETPAVSRNDTVTVGVTVGAVRVKARARALDTGLSADSIRVQNLDSRRVVTGTSSLREPSPSEDDVHEPAPYRLRPRAGLPFSPAVVRGSIHFGKPPDFTPVGRDAEDGRLTTEDVVRRLPTPTPPPALPSAPGSSGRRAR